MFRSVGRYALLKIYSVENLFCGRFILWEISVVGVSQRKNTMLPQRVLSAVNLSLIAVLRHVPDLHR